MMSFLDGLNQNGPLSQPPPQAAGATDVVIQLQGIVRQLTALVSAVNDSAVTAQFTALVNAISIRSVSGSFTMPPATSLMTILQPAVQAQSTILLTAMNSDAALAQKNNGIYIYAISPGVSFTISTQVGAVSGSPVFAYTVISPT